MADDRPNLTVVGDDAPKRGTSTALRNRSSRVVAAERRRKALQLRRAGATYDQIAEALEVTPNRCRQYVREALKAIEVEVNETASEIKRLELERLDNMLRIIEPKVAAAAAGGDWRPMQMQIRVQERRAKLLGLDAASKHEVSGRVEVEHGFDREEIDDLEREWRETSIDAEEVVELPEEAEVDPGSG
jgi:predicted transcriptional regulator